MKLSNKQIKRIAKQIKGYTPEEFDDVLEQDEAHQEFMRGEEALSDPSYTQFRKELMSAFHSFVNSTSQDPEQVAELGISALKDIIIAFDDYRVGE